MAKGKGALAKSPTGGKKTNRSYQDIRKQYQGLAGKSDTQSRSLRRNLMKEMQQARRQQKAAQPPTQPPAPSAYEAPQQNVSQGMQQYMDYMQQQGAFNPGSFQDQMNQAYGNVMKQFEMTTGPQFQREQADFLQMAAERGLDPNSEAYRSLQQQLNQRQDTARQTAMLQANQAAQVVQEQAFGQAERQYQMPGRMLEAYAPFYGQMGETARLGQQQQFLGSESEKQRAFEQAQAARENQYRLQQIRASPGSGALSFEQQMALADRDFYNRAALQQGQQPAQPNTASSAIGGFAAGFGSAIPGAIMGRRS